MLAGQYFPVRFMVITIIPLLECWALQFSYFSHARGNKILQGHLHSGRIIQSGCKMPQRTLSLVAKQSWAYTNWDILEAIYCNLQHTVTQARLETMQYIRTNVKELHQLSNYSSPALKSYITHTFSLSILHDWHTHTHTPQLILQTIMKQHLLSVM